MAWGQQGWWGLLGFSYSTIHVAQSRTVNNKGVQGEGQQHVVLGRHGAGPTVYFVVGTGLHFRQRALAGCLHQP